MLFTHFSFKLFSSQLNCILIKAVYGNMNLLSRDDVEDNIMRLESREVAEELLGMMPTNVCFNEEIVGENV